MGNELEKREKQAVSHDAAERMDQSGPSFSPDVDIFHNRDELVFIVDLPGVRKGDVTIQVDENNALVIRAKNSLKELDGSMLKQFIVGDYYRAFQITEEYDKDNIFATLENGSLEVTVPKREEAKPRMIEINA